MRFLLPLLPLALLLGCRSDGDSQAATEFSRGVVISHRVNDVWIASRSVMMGIGQGAKQIDDQGHEISAMIDGEAVSVRIEEYDASRSILRVITKDADLAQMVQDSITAMLPR